MSRARGVFCVSAAMAVTGVSILAMGLLVAATRVDLTLPAVGQLADACRRWALPDLDVASILVLALGALGMAAGARTARSVLRQTIATRCVTRNLRVVGRVPAWPHVRLVDDARPQAFCLGLLRPHAYLSTGAVELLSDRELDAVLAHEAHHTQRRDPLRLLVGRALADGLFFLPALRPLTDRYAAMAELAADEAAVRASRGPQPLAAALLVFDAFPDRAVVGIAPERVDHLAGDHVGWDLPIMLLVGAIVTLAALGALTIRLAEAATQASVGVPTLLADACMLTMALLPVCLAAAALLGGRRLIGRA